MLYDKDLILPFQLLDKIGELGENNTDIDPVSKCFHMLENGREKIFGKATQNIKKAQAHQSKGYNKKNGAGVPFEVGEKVLKCN